MGKILYIDVEKLGNLESIEMDSPLPRN